MLNIPIFKWLDLGPICKVMFLEKNKWTTILGLIVLIIVHIFKSTKYDTNMGDKQT